MTFDEWFEKTKTQDPYCWQGFTYADIWEAGQKAEREACAAECERMVMYPRGKQEAPAHDNVWAAAKAIRERGEQK